MHHVATPISCGVMTLYGLPPTPEEFLTEAKEKICGDIYYRRMILFSDNEYGPGWTIAKYLKEKGIGTITESPSVQGIHGTQIKTFIWIAPDKGEWPKGLPEERKPEGAAKVVPAQANPWDPAAVVQVIPDNIFEAI